MSLFDEMVPDEPEASVPAQDMRGQLTPGRRRAYILAGNAIVTVRSSTTGNRYTFKVTQSDPQPGRMPVWFVGLLAGPDNNSDYQYMGTLFAHGFRRTGKSRISEAAPAFQAFRWLSQHWEDSRVEVWHEGTCGRCGRRLTTPESIESGIGPVCADKGF